MRKSILKFISILFIGTFGSSKSMAQEDIGNEYRITLFPSHKVTDKIGGFGYLGYVWNPESGLKYSDNIYRINFKLGIHKGILGSLYNPDLDD